MLLDLADDHVDSDVIAERWHIDLELVGAVLAGYITRDHPGVDGDRFVDDDGDTAVLERIRAQSFEYLDMGVASTDKNDLVSHDLRRIRFPGVSNLAARKVENPPVPVL